MQILRYGCDHCGKEFGTADHLRFKNLQMWIDTFDLASKKWVPDKKIGKDNIGPDKELHFCDIKCVTDYLNTKMVEPNESPGNDVDVDILLSIEKYKELQRAIKAEDQRKACDAKKYAWIEKVKDL